VQGDPDLDLIEAAARSAGSVAVPFFHKGAESWLKAGDAPVTEADLAVDRHLHDALLGARPAHGWLSEESDADHPPRLKGPGRTFVVDPIDGTRGFMERSDEWTICIAVLEAGVPVAGVVFNPLRDEMFAAGTGTGATLNGRALRVADKDSMDGAMLAAGKRAMRAFGARAAAMQGRYVPSLAYRLAGVVSGVYDGTVSTGRAHIWDIAAAALIVTEAGGLVTDVDAVAPDYTAEDHRVPPLVVAGPKLHPLLCTALRAHADPRSTR
jgi:myo-inositol-1(or 4)-monophosphatase